MSEIDTNFKGRREDLRLVTGHGKFTNDWNLNGQAHAAFRRSDRAHARIASIDAGTAKSAPGVLAVLTARDLEDAGFVTLPPIQPPPGRGGQATSHPNGPISRATACASSARKLRLSSRKPPRRRATPPK